MKNFILKINRALVAKKKFYTLFLALIASVGTLFAASGTCGANLTWNLTDGVLTISGTGDMDNWEHGGGVPWYSYRDNIKRVTIGNSVTSIGGGAFSLCTSLTSITIPNSVTSIGDEAFSYCTGLTSITIPNSVTSIGDRAFEGCTSLTSVTIPNSVTSIGYGAFSRCTGLTSITIPNSVTSIGDRAFQYCSSLTSITIPNSVTSIGDRAFEECTSLTSVTIPNSVTSIGNYAFYGCTGLTSVICLGEIPPALGVWVFSVNLSIYVPCGSLDTYKNAVGWSGYTDKIKYVPYPSYAITKNAENGNINTTSTDGFTICDEHHPVTCTAIPNRGYQFVRWSDGNTDNPRTIELTQDTTMEAIFDYLLTGKCGKDSALTWNLDTTTMALDISGEGELTDNQSYGSFIRSLAIGNKVTIIGRESFEDFRDLKSVILGSSVKLLENEAFKGCTAIETITCYSQRPPTVNNYALYGLDYSTIVYVPAAYLNYYVMHDAWGLYDVRPMGLALNLTANNDQYGAVIGGGTYTADTQVTISAQPSYGYHFVQWSDGNTENPRNIILTQDTSLTAIFAVDKSGNCGDNLALKWEYDDKSKTLTINGRGTLNSNYTFGIEAPSQMKVLVIGNDITEIGDSAFYGKTTLNHLTIGAKVAHIGDYAFSECRSFDDITCYANEVPAINGKTFANIGNKQYIYLYVPEGRQRAYQRDEYWGEFDVQVKGAEAVTDPVEDVNVEPTDNTATVTWPAVTSAVTYEIVITKDGEVVCTLIFNANGQLVGIAFAPSANSPQTQTTGFIFTITGLEAGTDYNMTITAKNEDGLELDQKNVSFHTDGTQGIEEVHINSGESHKLLRNGQIFILRGDKTYTVQGQEVK